MDPTILSRPDKSTLPQQTLMELLVAEFDDKEAFRDSDGYFTDIADWVGVTVSDASEVTDINWEKEMGFGLFGDDDDDDALDDLGIPKPGGSIDLSLVPPTVIDLLIPDLKLHGTIDTFALPRSLSTIDLDGNNFHGTFAAKGLPSGIDSIYIGNNRLSGTFDIAALPRKLGVVSLAKNMFGGTLSLKDFPPDLQFAVFIDNQFHGPVDLSVLPKRLYNLRLEGNNFAFPNPLIVPSKSVNVCILDEEGVHDVVTTEGVKLETTRYMRATAIRVVWPTTAN